MGDIGPECLGDIVGMLEGSTRSREANVGQR
jgi:hypothetical protein